MIDNSQETRLTPPVNNQDHIAGPNNAPVTLVEFGDFQCPDCGQAYPIVEEIRRRMGDQLRFVFREFPLVEMHQYAEHAAEAAEAAGAQGKFWQMYNYLFQHQQALDDQHLQEYAEDIGLNLEKFDREMYDQTFTPRVEEDIVSGDKSGVQGTPTFFINGLLYNDSYDVDTLLSALERATKGRSS